MKTSLRLAKTVRRVLLAAFLAVVPTFVAAETALGPFRTAEDLQSARHLLDVDGNEINERVSEQKESLGFIVVTQVIGPEAGRQLVDEMKAAGLVDIVYVRTGVYAGRVSGGVYGSTGNAGLRVARLGDMGFDLTVLERTRTVSYQGWIDTTAGVTGDTIEAIEKAVGYSIQVDREEPEPVAEVEIASVEQRVEPEPAPAVGMDMEEGPALREEPEPVALVETPVAPPTMSVTTRPPEKESGDLPLFSIILIAVLVSAGAAFAYVRYSNRSALEGTLIRFDEEKQPESSQEDAETPSAAAERPAITELAEAVMSDAVAADSNALLETFAATDIEIVDLIDDLIDLARPRAGGVDNDRLTFDLAALVEDVVINARTRFPDNTIKLETLNSLPVVRADAGKIGRILRNLIRQTLELDNAAHIEITAAYESAPHQLLIVSIDNEFARLDESEVGALFDADTTSGMRLSVTRKLAEQAGGDVVVASGEGKGTIFRLSIPVLFAEDEVLLSNGLTVGELVDSAAVARAEVDMRQEALEQARALLAERTTAFEEAEARARSESELQVQLANEANAKVEALTAELAEAREAAAADETSRGESIAEAVEKVEALTAQLQVAVQRAEEEASAREALEAEGRSQVAALTAELEEARQRMDHELSLREHAEVQAAERARELSAELDSLRARQVEDEARLRAEESQAQHEISALRTELEASRQALAEADEHRSEALAALELRNEALENAVQQAQEKVAAGDSGRREAEAEVERLKADLEASRVQLESLSARESSALEELRQQNAGLDAAIRDAQAKLARDQQARAEAEAAANAEVAKLNQALAAANRKVEEEAVARTEAETNRRSQLEGLSEELARTREELAQVREAEAAGVPDIDALRAQLTEATERLQQETTARVRAEQEIAREVDRLMNDLNEARASLRKESRAREDSERAAEERIGELSAELEDARRRLVVESDARRSAEESLKASMESKASEDEGGRTAVGPGAEVAAEVAEAAEVPVRSSMPMNNPILRSMAERFVARLGEQLETLEQALAEGNPSEILAIASWIKGEAYTLGFHDFAGPASELEDFVKDKEYGRIPGRIVALRSLVSRVDLGEAATPIKKTEASPEIPVVAKLRYKLPSNPRKAEMMDNFIAQLGTQLLEMEAAFARNRTKELRRLIRWILKYAGAFGMTEIIELSEGLAQALDGDGSGASEKLAELAQVYSTIEVVRS